MFTKRGSTPARSDRELVRRAAIWATFVLPTVVLLLAVSAFGFEEPSRAERQQIAELLGVLPGMSVADIGAGDGRYAWDLADRVGPGGQVWATEVDEDRLRDIRRHIESHGLENVRAVLGDQENTGLDGGCCDAILLRHVYHHFADPSAMRAGMRWALRPGGRLLVIEFEPSGERVPAGVDRGGHGLTMEELIAEMTEHGWVALQRVREWNGRESHYAVLFEAAATTS